MNLDFDVDDINRVLEPYLVKRVGRDDAEWRSEASRLESKWRKRRRRRQWARWLPAALRTTSSRGGRRSTEQVKREYEEIWRERPVQASGVPLDHRPIHASWGDEGLFVRRGALPRVHLVLMAEVIERLQPKSVLEVGCGDGRNLFAMASRFPEIRWRGLELSSAGVASGKKSQESAEMPEHLRSFLPWEPSRSEAFREVELNQGDASSMPFDDSEVDLIMTHLALEQMNPIREAVLSEIARVADKNVLLLEPFADFNRTAVQADFVAANDYLSMPLSELAPLGIRVLGQSEDFPQKTRLGQGLVVGETTRA